MCVDCGETSFAVVALDVGVQRQDGVSLYLLEKAQVTFIFAENLSKRAAVHLDVGKDGFSVREDHYVSLAVDVECRNIQP